MSSAVFLAPEGGCGLILPSDQALCPGVDLPPSYHLYPGVKKKAKHWVRISSVINMTQPI